MSQNQSQEAIKLKLNELYEDAKSKGTITRDEVASQIMELEIDADQMNKVFETLEALGVDVVAEFDPVPPDELDVLIKSLHAIYDYFYDQEEA